MPDVDIIEHFQRSSPIPGARCSDFHTIHLDLTQDPETLFSGLSETCRYKIRRAEREDLKTEAWMSARDELVDDFIAFFDRFARGKGLPPAPAERLHALAEAAVLDLSTVCRDDDPLVWHAYLRAGNRARLLHSASLFREYKDTGRRNMIGRANRYLHWHDLLRYKDAGIPLFDFGGWYSGHDNEELLRINAFKESFGGHVVPEFHCAVPDFTTWSLGAVRSTAPQPLAAVAKAISGRRGGRYRRPVPGVCRGRRCPAAVHVEPPNRALDGFAGGIVRETHEAHRKSAEGAANVITTTGAYGGGTAVMNVREIRGYDDLANAVSARPRQVDRYRELLSGWLRPLEQARIPPGLVPAVRLHISWETSTGVQRGRDPYAY